MIIIVFLRFIMMSCLCSNRVRKLLSSFCTLSTLLFFIFWSCQSLLRLHIDSFFILCANLIIIFPCNALEIYTVSFRIPIVVTGFAWFSMNFMKPWGISDLSSDWYLSVLSRDLYSLDQNCQSQMPDCGTCGSLNEWRVTVRPRSLKSCHFYKCYQKGQIFQLLISYFTLSFKRATSSCHILTIRPREQPDLIPWLWWGRAGDFKPFCLLIEISLG